jgi:hypothetical protein
VREKEYLGDVTDFSLNEGKENVVQNGSSYFA